MGAGHHLRKIGIVPPERPKWCSVFSRYAPKRVRRRKLAVWDIETADATLLGPAGGIAFTSERDFPALHRFGNHSRQSCLIHFLKHFLRDRYRGYVAYAHKGMSFDVTHLLSSIEVQRWLLRHGFTVEVTTSFVSIRKGKMSWLLADSLRLIPERLEKILATFAPDYTKAPLPTTRFSWHDPAWRLRIEQDTLGLYVALGKLEALMLEHFGVPLSLTMPATALRAARRLLPIAGTHRPSRTALDWLRAASYSGGRIEVFWQGPVQGHIYVTDINSAYAWALKQPFPLGAGRYTRREPPKAYVIGRCALTVPRSAIPPVLSRLYHHSFPVGTFQAVLTREEIALARELGATVEFLEGWTWARTAPLFRPFIDRCETLRRTDYAGPLGRAVKLAQNGLYGILGMNSFRRHFMAAADDPGRPWTAAFDTSTGEYVPNVWEAVLYKESPNHMAHWAAIIAARVRVQLSRYLRLVERAGLQPLYAHTDSIWMTSPNGLPPEVDALVGSEYGQLKIERRGSAAILVGPGEAALKLDGAENAWHVVSKGWAADPKDFQAATDGRGRSIEQVQVFRAATGLRRRSPGRTIKKIVGNYSAMRNRRPPASRPGPTTPHDAEVFDYSYWKFTKWYVGKILAEPPRRSKARIISPPTAFHGQWWQRDPKVRARSVAAGKAAAIRAMREEWWELYDAGHVSDHPSGPRPVSRRLRRDPVHRLLRRRARKRAPP